MDTAIGVGLLDVGLVDPASLSVPLTGKTAPAHAPPACDRAPATCTLAKPPAPGASTIAPPVGLTLPDTEQKAQLKSAPIVSIEGDRILLNGQLVAEVSRLPPGTWKIDGLYEAIRATPGSGAVILQADPTTDAKVVTDVMKTLYAAERPNVMFATRGRPRDPKPR
jgi:biopolymer transport protein ExbD